MANLCILLICNMQVILYKYMTDVPNIFLEESETVFRQVIS